MLPGARGVLFTISIGQRTRSRQVAVLDLKTGLSKKSGLGSQAEYVETGHLVYSDAGALWAGRFDLTTLNVLGDPAPLSDQLLALAAGGFRDFQRRHPGLRAGGRRDVTIAGMGHPARR